MVIAAGPGYGKSTLLAQFAGEVEFSVCWITLNPWDADLATFVADLCQTLSQRFPKFGADLESALATYQGLGDDIQRLAAMFVKELESNAEDYFMLVVDDFHQVEESESVTGFLDLVVPNLPDHCHLVISSRSVPRIRELRRLIVNREGFVLSQGDLKLDPNESRDLIRQVSGNPMDEERADAIVEMCDGWPGAIVMACTGADPQPGGPGTGELFTEYLAEELLERQSSAVQSFLVGTSLFPVLTPEACDALLEIDHSVDILWELRRKNLAVEVPGVGKQTVYRIHTLLRQFLCERLNVGRKDQLEALGASAGVLLRREGYWEEALELFSDAGAYEQAADLLVDVSAQLAGEERWSKLAALIDLMPRPIVVSVPELGIRRAHSAVVAGDLRFASQIIEEVIANPSRADIARHLPWALLEKSNISLHQGEVAEAERLTVRAKELLLECEPDPNVIAQAYHSLGVLHAISRRPDAAKECFELALEVCGKFGGLTRYSAKVNSDLGTLAAEQGKASVAKIHYDLAATEFERAGNELGRTISMNNLGYAYHLLAQFDVAEQVLVEAISEASRLRLKREQAYAQVTLGDGYVARRWFRKALTAYARGLRLGRSCDERRLVVFALEGLARCAANSGQIRWAEIQLDEAEQLAEDVGSPGQLAFLRVSRAMINIRMGSYQRALEQLDNSLELLGQDLGGPEECWTRLYRAHVLQELGDRNAAMLEIDRLGHVLMADELDPYFLVPDITGLPALEVVISKVPGVDHTVETLRYEVERILQEIDSDEPDEPAFMDAESGELPGSVSVKGFGATLVEVDGREVTSGDWRNKIAKELFFLLAYHAGPITKGEIIAALWPEKEPAKAESGLKSSLFRARRALHQDWIVYEDGKYHLAPQGKYHFDVTRFKEALNIAGRMPQDANLRFRYVEEAVGLYNGDFLPEFYSEWCIDERAALERWFMHSASVVARHHAKLGDHEEAGRVGDKILSVDPYNEEALTVVLAAFAATGNYAAGEHRYRDYRDIVASELGEQPSAKIETVSRSLYQDRAQSIRAE